MQVDREKVIVPPDKLDRRNGGCGVILDNQLYVWGGTGTDIRYPYREILQKQQQNNTVANRSGGDGSEEEDDSDEDSDSDGEQLDPDFEIKTVVTLPRPKDPDHPFDVLDLATRTWYRQPTTGDYPTLGLGSSLNVHHPSRTIILFSGFNDLKFDSEVYKVSPDTDWMWTRVEVMSEIKPTPRYLTGVVIYKDRMCIFGGVGKPIRKIGNPPKSQDPGGKDRIYIEDGEARDYGWTSEYLEFQIHSDEWIAPLDEDAVRPEILGSHAFSRFDSHRAVLFGGNGSLIYSNNAYIFDLETNVWSGALSRSGPDQPWPVASRFSTLTSLVDPDKVGLKAYNGYGPVLEPRMVLLWGKSTRSHISPESWLLEFKGPLQTRLKWTQIRIGVDPRSWHIARPLYSSSGTACDVVVYGGNMYKDFSNFARDNASNLKILQFGARSLVDICLMAIVQCRELMERAAQEYPGFKGQISNTHHRHSNCPLTTDISFL